MKVYIVGDDGPEHNEVISIHKDYKNALKVWNDRNSKGKKSIIKTNSNKI